MDESRKMQCFKFEQEIIDKIYHNLTMRAIVDGNNIPESKSDYIRRIVNEDYEKWEKLIGKKNENL
jgi:hypothetical protein